MTPARSKMVKLILRVSPSAARDIDAFLQKDAWGSRGSVVREALLSFFRHDFDDPFPLGSGHADFPEHWGRLLPRPAPDTSVKEVKEPLSIRITVRLPRDFVSRVDVAAKRHNFDNRTEFI